MKRADFGGRIRAMLGRGGWEQLRADYRALPGEVRQAWAATRETWWDLIAEIREGRHWTRRGNQMIAGRQNPSRREVRQAGRAILAEADAMDAIERRVVADHEQEGQL